jgi:pepsin A
MMQNQAGWIWEDVPIEGIVGLGFPSLANTDGHPPFFDSVIQQKALKRNEFAFYVSRENPAANALMWGGVDSRFYAGRIEWFPVVDPHYWALELAQFRVGNVTFHFSQDEKPSRRYAGGLVGKPKPHKQVAVLDTGTSVLGFSGAVLSSLVQLLPEALCSEVLEDGANGTELKYPDMVFVLRNKAGLLREWALTGRQYMSRDEEGDMCSPSIMTLDLPAEHGPGLVLGDVFLREYFSVYSRRNGTPEAADVGLARSRRTEDIVDHLKALTDDQESLLHF